MSDEKPFLFEIDFSPNIKIGDIVRIRDGKRLLCDFIYDYDRDRVGELPILIPRRIINNTKQ